MEMATRVVRKEEKRRGEKRREESTLGVLCALLGAVYVYVCVCVFVCVCVMGGVLVSAVPHTNTQV